MTGNFYYAAYIQSRTVIASFKPGPSLYTGFQRSLRSNNDKQSSPLLYIYLTFHSCTPLQYTPNRSAGSRRACITSTPFTHLHLYGLESEHKYVYSNGSHRLSHFCGDTAYPGTTQSSLIDVITLPFLNCSHSPSNRHLESKH